MDKLTKYMESYHAYHQKSFTKLTHVLGVPLIILALQMMLSLLSPWAAWIATIGLVIYYFFLNIPLACTTGFFLVILASIAQYFLNHSSLGTFVLLSIIFFSVGWCLQFLGHLVEGKKPAFLDNFWQVFTAPIFLCAELLHLLKIKY